jgi:hypothetical protein
MQKTFFRWKLFISKLLPDEIDPVDSQPIEIIVQSNEYLRYTISAEKGEIFCDLGGIIIKNEYVIGAKREDIWKI